MENHLKTGKADQEEKPKGIWGILILTILYLVSPIDLLPEALLGPLGFIDDAALFAYLIKRFLQR